MSLLPGIGGSLFPGRFLLHTYCARPADTAPLEPLRRHFTGWWRQAESVCGPATGLRALFDLVAMPLAGLLGYRARDASFERHRAFVRLHARGGSSVPMLVLPWSGRPSRIWRDLHQNGEDSPWWLVVAPPFVSLVDSRGHAFRRSADFRFPDAIDVRSFPAFFSICRAETLASDAGDRLVADAMVFQDGVRRDLQSGVTTALRELAPVLARGPRSGTNEQRFTEALTLIYRVLFLLFAESRSMAITGDPRYARAYSVTALCGDAVARAETGLWDGLAAVTRLSRSGCDAADLVVRPFNGRLFARGSAPELERGAAARPTRISRRRDAALSKALVALATRPGQAGREHISYGDLGVEQLGAVYERILDVDPSTLVDPGVSPPHPAPAPKGHSRRRKESGTFYTPQSLAELVVRRTLAPLTHNASSDEILALRIVDPSMGSGAFLVAACRFLAHAYEHALVDEGRIGESDLDAEAREGMRRLVASRCLAGVDCNPTAVQLARLSLWLATLAREKPLSFFDHQLRIGDSLIGASPDDLWRLPASKRTNQSGTPLFEAAGLEAAVRDVAQPWRELRERRDDTVSDVRERERLWAGIAGDRSPLAPWRAACDLWCARWFWDPGSSPPSPAETRATIDGLLRLDRSLDAARTRDWISSARRIGRERNFFHWPIEFADVFYSSDGGPRGRPGFDAVIGNPPWEMLRGDGSRRDLVAFVRESGLYPACDRGHLNLYQPFLERCLSLARAGGRVGLVLPWSLATDEGAISLRQKLFERCRVDTIVGLDNGAGLFPIHRGSRFLVLTTSPRSGARTTHAVFGLKTAEEIDALPGLTDAEDRPALPVRLDLDTLRRAGGAALRVPDVRRPGDLTWLVEVSARFPRLGSSAGWHARFGRELNVTDDRDTFGDKGLPVIEGKHLSPFRVASHDAVVRIPERDAAMRLPDRRFTRTRLAYRDVAAFGNRLTLIAALVPARVVTTHTLFCLRNDLPIEQQAFLCGLFNSFPLNRIVRMLMGSHVTTGLVENLPVPNWTADARQKRIAELVLALTSGLDGRAKTDACAEVDALVDRLYV
jgi:hypothetical protein